MGKKIIARKEPKRETCRLYPWDEVKDEQLRKAKRLLAEADTLLTGYACSCFLFDNIDRAREVEAFQGCIQKFLMNGWKE